jgi:hypothetical protein
MKNAAESVKKELSLFPHFLSLKNQLSMQTSIKNEHFYAIKKNFHMLRGCCAYNKMILDSFTQIFPSHVFLKYIAW